MLLLGDNGDIEIETRYAKMEGEGVSVRTKKDLVGETETLVLGEELNSVKDASQNHNGPVEDKIGEKEVETVDKTKVEEVPVVVNGKESEHISSVFSTEDEDDDDDDLVLFNRHEGQRDRLVRCARVAMGYNGPGPFIDPPHGVCGPLWVLSENWLRLLLTCVSFGGYRAKIMVYYVEGK